MRYRCVFFENLLQHCNIMNDIIHGLLCVHALCKHRHPLSCPPNPNSAAACSLSMISPLPVHRRYVASPLTHLDKQNLCVVDSGMRRGEEGRGGERAERGVAGVGGEALGPLQPSDAQPWCRPVPFVVRAAKGQSFIS